MTTATTMKMTITMAMMIMMLMTMKTLSAIIRKHAIMMTTMTARDKTNDGANEAKGDVITDDTDVSTFYDYNTDDN